MKKSNNLYFKIKENSILLKATAKKTLFFKSRILISTVSYLTKSTLKKLVLKVLMKYLNKVEDSLSKK